MDLATVDKLLTTTRTVRKRLDLTRAVALGSSKPVSKLLFRHPLAGTFPAITSWWSPMQPNVLLLLPSTNGHTWRVFPTAASGGSANRTPLDRVCDVSR